MTVKELIEKLNQFEGELDVCVCTIVNDENVPFELRDVSINDETMEVELEAHPLGE